MARARQAFEDVEFHPGILTDVSTVDTTTQVLGGTSALPFGIAPTGFTRLMQTEGEIADPARRGQRASPSPSQPWVQPALRMCAESTQMAACGSSCT